MAAQVRHRQASEGPDWPGVPIDGVGDAYSETGCLTTGSSMAPGQSTLTEVAKLRDFLASWVSEGSQAPEVEDLHATQTSLLKAMKRSADARSEPGTPPLQIPATGAIVDQDVEIEKRTPAPPSLPKPSNGSGRSTLSFSRCISNDNLDFPSSTTSSPQRRHSGGRCTDDKADLDGEEKVEWGRGARSCPRMAEQTLMQAPSPQPGSGPQRSGGILPRNKEGSNPIPIYASGAHSPVHRTDETRADVAGVMTASRSPSLLLSGGDGGGFGGRGSPQGWASGYGYGGVEGAEAQAKALLAVRNRAFGEQRARHPTYQRSASFQQPPRSTVETGWHATEDGNMRGGDVLVSGRDTVRVPIPGGRMMNAKMLLTLRKMTKQIDELTAALEGDREREEEERESLSLPPSTQLLLPPASPLSEETHIRELSPRGALTEGGLESARRTARQLRGSIHSFASHLRQMDAREQARRAEVTSLHDDLAACAALVHERDIRLAAVRSAKKECEKTMSEQQELLQELAEKGTVLFDS